MSIKLDQIADPRLRARIEQALEAGRSSGRGVVDRRMAPESDSYGLTSQATKQHDQRVQTPRARPLPESDLHDKVEEYCRAKGWFYVHSRMDRRSTVAVGTPDWCIAAHGGRMLWLELKRQGGKATLAQQGAIAQLTKLGHLAAIVDNWPDALRLLEGL